MNKDKRRCGLRNKYSVFFLLLGFVCFMAVNPFEVGRYAEAATGPVRMVPESFSQLAEMVGPAVVNIRTVKTIKGGGRVFRHFKRPFDKDDPMRDFF